MQQWGSNEVRGLVKKLVSIHSQIDQNKESVMTMYSKMYSNFDPKKDARITAFSKMINLFNSVELALTIVSKYLLDLNWWKATNIPEYAARHYVKEFRSFLKIGFVHSLFSATESSLRLFLRTLDPTACDGGTGSFKSVYDCLLRSNLSTYSSESIKTLDLLRLVRNTIHNNGVYFARNGRDTPITWRGELYEFRHSTPIDFVTWKFLLEVSDATRSVVYTIITDASLRAVTHTIPDPFAS